MLWNYTWIKQDFVLPLHVCAGSLQGKPIESRVYNNCDASNSSKQASKTGRISKVSSRQALAPDGWSGFVQS